MRGAATIMIHTELEIALKNIEYLDQFRGIQTQGLLHVRTTIASKNNIYVSLFLFLDWDLLNNDIMKECFFRFKNNSLLSNVVAVPPLPPATVTVCSSVHLCTAAACSRQPHLITVDNRWWCRETSFKYTYIRIPLWSSSSNNNNNNWYLSNARASYNYPRTPFFSLCPASLSAVKCIFR